MNNPIIRFITLFSVATLSTIVSAGDSEGKKIDAKTNLEAHPRSVKQSVLITCASEQNEVVRRKCVGFVTPIERVDLVTRVSGDLATIGFKDGDIVEKGQLLYKIDDIRYVAAVKSAQAGLAQAQAKAAYAQVAYTRRNELSQRHAVSVDTMENARSENDIAKATLLDCEAKLILALDDLTNTVIHAPIAGKISATAYTCGNYITPNSGILASIVQQDPIRVSFTFGNKDLMDMFGNEAMLRKHAVLRVVLANGQEYPDKGIIDFVDNHANRQTDALRIYARFANLNRTLVPDSAVTVIVETTSDLRYPALPPSAVQYDEKGAFLYVLDTANRIERRSITTGVNTGTLQIIRSGLKANERVVVEGTLKVMPGMEVTPVIQEK